MIQDTADGILPKPTYEEIEAALLLASKALNYVGMDRWEMECLGDDLDAIDKIVQRIDANKKRAS